MEMESNFKRNNGKEHSRSVKGTRFHELHLHPLPPDATEKKVRSLIQKVSGIKVKDIRIPKKNSGTGTSAFIVFFDDISAASVLKAFRNDPLYVENKKVDVNYTIDYEAPARRLPPGKPSQQLVNRIRTAFSWTTEHNIPQPHDLPAQLKEVVPSTSFTEIGSSFSCNEQHLVCKTFSEARDMRNDFPPVVAPSDIPEPVKYSCNEISKMYRTLQNLPSSGSTKPSKSVRRRAARKRENVMIEAKLDNIQNVTPLKPGMGRGFNQHGRDTSKILAPSINQSRNSSAVSSKKPFAFDLEKDEKERKKSVTLSKGRGQGVITAEMRTALQRY